ncbi:hypothetical protein JCM15519_27840 [Fundidesulfovibrio butyratiphilus]
MKSLAVFEQLGLLVRSCSRGGSAPQGQVHAFHHHTPLWAYCHPGLARPYAGNEKLPDVFAEPPAGTTLAQAMARTQLLVFLGAAHTPQLEAALARPHGVCLVFEPDPERMEAYLSAVKPHTLLARRNVFFVTGDPDDMIPPLLFLLPEDICDQGYPLFFAREGLAEALPEYVRRVEEMIELFYYRNVIYPLDSQEHVRGLPIRPMLREAIYDRFKHHYENLLPCLTSGTLTDLTGACAGYPAILCAAGPALTDSVDFVRRNRDRAVVIAVNNALKPLLRAGVEPHFTVINDTSVESERSFADLAKLTHCVLVAHCQSCSGRGAFAKTYFFGNFPGQPFPRRASLLLHGSVITTAFSLAELLGCSQAVLAGVQLSSPDPFALNYAPGSMHEAHRSGSTDKTALPGRWPQLYPARTLDGHLHYTTLNFFDAAQWFADRIAQATLPVTNLCPTSILAGRSILFDPDPALPPLDGLDERLAALPRADFSGRRDRVIDHIRQEMTRIKTKQLAARQAGTSLEAARAFIAQCDADNFSFMVQRFADFDNKRFHAGFFASPDPNRQQEAAAYFLTRMDAMCATLLKILLKQHAGASALAR